MLVVSREVGERIKVGDDVWVTIMRVDGKKRVRVGVEAPEDVKIVREELLANVEKHP